MDYIQKQGFMKVSKRIISLCLAVILLTGLSFPASGYTVITSPSKVSGSDFTDVKNFAKALDKVFAGDIDIFSDSACKNEQSMPVGFVMSTSTTYYVKSKITGTLCSGKQCYIYANAVYNKLFRDWPGHGKTSENFEMAVSKGSKTISYKMFLKAGVRCGAYVRTTANSDGSYSSNYGHSFIILGYDEYAVTYLEGNSDGKGLVRITVRTWDEVNKALLTGKDRRISHIVQPTNEYFKSLYGEPGDSGKPDVQIPVHDHVYEVSFRAEPECLEAGVCTYSCECGDCYTEITPALGHSDTDGDGVCERCLRNASYTDVTAGDCGCACHSRLPIRAFVFKIKCIIWRITGSYRYCACGDRHW